MKDAKIEKLCELVRSMELIQTFSLEKVYNLENDFLSLNVTMILSPKVCYLGEKRLKIVFYGVKDLKLQSSVYDMIFAPVMAIKDISSWSWENCNYFVEEIEGEFSLKCDYFEYELLPEAEII